jgi:hypothetical protein
MGSDTHKYEVRSDAGVLPAGGFFRTMSLRLPRPQRKRLG